MFFKTNLVSDQTDSYYFFTPICCITGTDENGERMEVIELADHPYYVATQYHPEYLSRPLKPSPPFLGLVLAAVGRLQLYLSRGCRLSPRESDNDSDYIDSGKIVLLKSTDFE